VFAVDWLTGNCWLFGMSGQNWMLVVAGGLAIYIGALIIGHYWRSRSQHAARKAPKISIR